MLRVYCHRSAHMTWISYGATAIAPLVPLLLVAPKFLADEMAWATSLAFGHRPVPVISAGPWDTFSLLALLGFIVACFVAALGGAMFRPRRLVRAPGQTVLAASQPTVRTGMDCPVFHHRRFRLVATEKGSSPRRLPRRGQIYYPMKHMGARFECWEA